MPETGMESGNQCKQLSATCFHTGNDKPFKSMNGQSSAIIPHWIRPDIGVCQWSAWKKRIVCAADPLPCGGCGTVSARADL